MAQFSGRTVSAGDAGMLVSGVVVGVASFLPWYGWRAGNTFQLQYTAWDNVLPLVAVVLVAVASVLAATRMFDGVRLRAIGPVGPSFLLVLLPAFAVVLIVAGWLTVGEATDPLLRSVLQGEARYGLFVGLGAAMVQLVFAALGFQASGEGFAGRGREVAPPPVPYGQPYGQQPTPGYWPYSPYTSAHAQAQPQPQAAPGHVPPTYGHQQPAYQRPAYQQPGPPSAFAPIDGPSPYARPVADPPPQLPPPVSLPAVAPADAPGSAPTPPPTPAPPPTPPPTPAPAPPPAPAAAAVPSSPISEERASEQRAAGPS